MVHRQPLVRVRPVVRRQVDHRLVDPAVRSAHPVVRLLHPLLIRHPIDPDFRDQVRSRFRSLSDQVHDWRDAGLLFRHPTQNRQLLRCLGEVPRFVRPRDVLLFEHRRRNLASKNQPLIAEHLLETVVAIADTCRTTRRPAMVPILVRLRWFHASLHATR